MARTLLLLLDRSLRGTRKEKTTMAAPRKSTLLDLVRTVNAFAASEDEVVATVTYLINSGKVLLCGNFAGAKIDLSEPVCAAPRERRPKA